ncbi:unnamed protein product, partial [Cyprideis torosa]
MPLIPVLDDQNLVDLHCSKAVCVGRNYADHAAELNNPVPIEPLLFIKPESALLAFTQDLPVDRQHAVHYELELTVLIGHTLRAATAAEAEDSILGIGLGIDLTRRDLQAILKDKGHPWEKAKAFDGSGIITPFVPLEEMPPLSDIGFSLMINGERRQQGHSSQMITPIIDLLVHASEYFTLNPGDIVFTGTP